MVGSRCKNWCFSLSPTWEKADIPVQSVNQKELSPVMEGWAFLFHSVLHLFGFRSPTLSRTISFTHSTDSNDNLIQKHPPRQLGQCLIKYLHTPKSQSSWHTKFTNMICNLQFNCYKNLKGLKEEFISEKKLFPSFMLQCYCSLIWYLLSSYTGEMPLEDWDFSTKSHSYREGVCWRCRQHPDHRITQHSSLLSH